VILGINPNEICNRDGPRVFAVQTVIVCVTRNFGYRGLTINDPVTFLKERKNHGPLSPEDSLRKRTVLTN
jgi:hypothetical protein